MIFLFSEICTVSSTLFSEDFLNVEANIGNKVLPGDSHKIEGPCVEGYSFVAKDDNVATIPTSLKTVCGGGRLQVISQFYCKKDFDLWLIVGLSLATFVLLLCILAACICCIRKNKRRTEEDNVYANDVELRPTSIVKNTNEVQHLEIGQLDMNEYAAGTASSIAMTNFAAKTAEADV